jgi:uncharacterized protein DUF1302
MRRAALALAACCLAAAADAGAAEPEAAAADWLSAPRVRGRAAEEFAYRLHDPGDVSKIKTLGWLDGKYTFSDTVNVRAAVRGWYDAVFEATDRYPPNVERDQKTDLSLREALLTVSAADVEVRLGRQQIVWGEALGTFVTDVVNPKDFREFVLPDFSELRIPLWAVDAIYRFTEGVSLQLVWTPDTMHNRLPKQGAEFQFARIPYRFRNPVVRLPDEQDQFSLTRSAGGVRLSMLASGWDVALIYYDREDANQVLFQRRVPQPPRPDIVVLVPEHPRLHIVGGTVAKSFEPVIVKAELALSINKHYETTDPLDADGVVRRDTIDYLVGVDYTFFERVDSSLQVSQKILTGPATNLTRGGVEGQFTTSVALRIATGFFDNTLNPSMLATVDVNRGDFRLSPRLDWLATGAVTLSVGADVFEGPHQTLYGQFDRNDRVWFTTTWRF